MLKKDFDILYKKVNDWLFDKFASFLTAKRYGALEMKDVNKTESFLQFQLLEYVHKANKRRSPLLELIIPGCIDCNDFNKLISNIKNKIS